MSQMAQGAGRGARSELVFAVVLILVGVVGIVSQVWKPTADVGGWVVAIIGLGLLGAFVYSRVYGYLVPGAILTGLGFGIVASQSFTWATSEGEGGAVVLGLGLGFVAIWVIATLLHLERPHWWALVPGGILAAVGGALLIGGGAVQMLDYWGVVLVAIGVLLIARFWMSSSKPS